MHTFITYRNQPEGKATIDIVTSDDAQATFQRLFDEGVDRVAHFNGRITVHYSRRGTLVNGSMWEQLMVTYGVPPQLATQTVRAV